MGIYKARAYKTPYKISDADFWTCVAALALFSFVTLYLIYTYIFG